MHRESLAYARSTYFAAAGAKHWVWHPVIPMHLDGTMIQRRCNFFLAFVIAWSIPLIAKAELIEGSTAELFQIYDRSEWETRKRIETLLAMTESGLKSANIYLATVRNERPLFCQPEKLQLAGRQLMNILRDGVKLDQSLLQKPWGFALLVSLQNTFPCPQPRSN
jgi:hypothetical protein